MSHQICNGPITLTGTSEQIIRWGTSGEMSPPKFGQKVKHNRLQYNFILQVETEYQDKTLSPPN